jgi:hypothetical protein
MMVIFMVGVLIVRLLVAKQVVVVVVDIVAEVEPVDLFHFESFTIRYTEVITVLDHFDVVHEADELTIVFVILEGSDGDTV